ncbi:transmembrane protein, partial [Cystoisospora suis]
RRNETLVGKKIRKKAKGEKQDKGEETEHSYCQELRQLQGDSSDSARNSSSSSSYEEALRFRFRCPKWGVCTGDMNNPCTEGNSGVLCNQCAEGYMRSWLLRTSAGCVKCGFLSYFLLVFCFLLLWAFCAYMVWLGRGTDVNSYSKSLVLWRIFVVHIQLLALY